MADLIDRQTAIETAIEAADRWDGAYSPERERIIRKFFDKVPAVQPDHVADVSKKAEGDCISRQTAIDCVTYDVEHTIECLKALPPAQPEERKKGAWILGFDNQYLEKYYFCSKCGSRKYMEDKPLDNFCPNCGADMRGEQDGRDD